MATKKKMLQAAAGNATGGAGLNVEDVFSTYLYEANESSQNINNGINLGDNIAGSVDFDGTGDSLKVTGGSFDYSGDITVEFWVYFDTLSGTSQNIFDARPSSGVADSFMIGTNTSNKMRLYAQNTSNYIEETNTPSTGTWYHYAVVRSSGTWTMYRDGTSTGTPVSSDTNDYSSGTISIGQRSFTDGLEFDGHISNLRVLTGSAEYTSNFTVPTEPLAKITNTALLICTDNNLEDDGPDRISFTVKGNPTPSSESPFSGNTGEGGLVWTKSRDNGYYHTLYDTERGVNKGLSSNDRTAEYSLIDTLNSFNSNGFTLGASENSNITVGTASASWTFRKAPKFFTCLTYTGDGVTTGRNISHDLGSNVGTIILKKTSGVSAWAVWHRALNSDEIIILNESSAKETNTGFFNGTAPTSTQFTVGEFMNDSGGTYVAYLFAHNDGDGDFGPDGNADAIKCGSYTTAADGTASIDLGFEPQWVMVKRSSGTSDWHIYDSMRGWANGSNDEYLEPNTSDAEASYNYGHPTATGFYYDGGFGSSTYIYIAIRRGTKVPESGTEVFAPVFHNNDSSEINVSGGFTADAFISKLRSGTDTYMTPRLLGGQTLRPSTTGAEIDYSANVAWDTQEGVNFTGWWGAVTDGIDWQWKRAPGFFDVVAYSGDAIAGRTVSHNLGVAPEMMWVKKRNGTANWIAYHKDLGNNAIIYPNLTNASFTSTGYWDSTTPTESVFTLGNSGNVNGTSDTFIAYLFASLPNVSKCGSYTGNGTSQTIDCGFTSGARFVLIKRTDSTSDWFMLDSARGIVAGNDPLLALNGNGAESTGYDIIDPDNSGFIINQTAWNTNVSSASYIFYAIA
jgi:hypothetical protein